MSSVEEVDFLVVGAGPVGAALALSLAKISASVSTALIDQNPQQVTGLGGEQGRGAKTVLKPPERSPPRYDTKVFAVNSGSRQLMEALGVWPAIVNDRACAYDRMHVWDSEGTGSVSFSVQELEDEENLVEELGFIVEAGVIQRALDRQITATRNIQIYRPTQIAHIEWRENRAHVTLDSGQQMVAKLLCAADGARSALRKQAAIGTAEEDCGQRALVANIQLTRPHESCAWQIFRPTGPLAFLPLQSEDNNHCSIVWTLDNDEAQRIGRLDDGRFLTELERAIEGRFGVLKLNSERIFVPLCQRHAIDYGASYGGSGLVLVGDAAHSIHPLAGLGANLGFQDVVALSKELTRARQRGIPFGHKSIVQRYQRQRRVDNEITLKLMKAFRVSFADQGPAINAFRNLGLNVFSRLKPLKKLVVKQALMFRGSLIE